MAADRTAAADQAVGPDDLSPAGVARRVMNAVIYLGAAFGHEQQFVDTAHRLGLDERALYFGARAGVLGAVDADVVAAVCGFFAPAHVRCAWRSALASGPLGRLVAEDVAMSMAWARRHLSTTHAPRVAELLDQVVDHADASGKPLFAAWRALPTPANDPAARVGLALLRLREHRGASHLIAVTAAGLSPLEAILAGHGPEKARMNGWREPFPSIEHGSDRMAVVERHTNVLAGAAYAHLTSAERAELVELLDSLHPAT